jgi:hypothetical protein
MKTVAIINTCKIPLSEFSLTHCKKIKSVLYKCQNMTNSILLCFCSFQTFLQHHKFENKNYKSLTGYIDSIV